MTIKDIAQIAEVSVSTVSRSLNDSPLVADATKRRIKAIANKQGFEFNAGARGMVTRRVNTIGVILPEDFDHFHVQLYHSSLHNDLRRALERAGLDLIVGFSHNRYDHTDNITRIVRRGKVDGLIIVDSAIEPEAEAFLKEAKTPYVFSHYPPETPRPDVDWVFVDHERGGMLVGDHFHCCGYKKVVILGSPDRGLEFQQRVDGLRKAFAHAEWEVDVELLPGLYSLETGYRLVLEHLDIIRRADALFALNDLLAIGAIQGCNAVGLSVPRDIAVVGYDDTPLAAALNPSLTTVHQPSEAVAFMTCERLIEMIEDRAHGRHHQPRQISLLPQLVMRDSSSSCGCG